MIEYARVFGTWVKGSARILTRGSRAYWLWVGFLGLAFLTGAVAYWRQLDQGLITTSLRDQVSWGFYIGNFNFLVGVADAAVLMIVAAFLYQWGPIKEVVVYSMMLAIAAICAETADEADYLAATGDLVWVRLQRGEFAELPSPDEARAYPYTAQERSVAESYRRLQYIGTPEAIRRRIEAAAAEAGADEIMVSSIIHDPGARRRSYDLLAGAFELSG